MIKNITQTGKKGILRGFSMGELLVVVAIVAILAMTVILAYQNQIIKAHDAKRKEDLRKYKIGFEDYYNDKGCYPTEEFWNNTCTCDGTCFDPYMEKFLCDPVTRAKYYYKSITDAQGNPDSCRGYLLYARLENKADPDIVAVGCSYTQGCGVGTPLSLYNYGIAVGGPLTAADFIPNPTSTPTLSPTPVVQGDNFCLGDRSGRCNKKTGCAPSYDKRACNEVLITEFGCQGFTDSNQCQTLCQSDYETYKCAGTEIIMCFPWTRSQCK